jgi:uncharacterized protein (DUF697 family)
MKGDRYEPGEYEKEQIHAINEWRMEKPTVINAALSYVMFPISIFLQAIVPESAMRGAIDGTSAAAEWLADEKDILRKGEVPAIDVLKSKDLLMSDTLANEIHNWAIGIASAEGAGSGMLGIYGLALDIPFIITFALRTIHKIGLCYGYKTKDEHNKHFVLALLSAAGANTAKEKAEAVKILRAIDVMVAKQTLKAIAKKAAQQQLSKEVVLISMNNLGRQLGLNITKRKALQAIPVIGAVVGSSVNAWFINDVGWAARRVFQERWLIENHMIKVQNDT